MTGVNEERARSAGAAGLSFKRDADDLRVLVHPSAVVEPGAELEPGVVIGAFCFVGSGVRVGAGTELLAHATLLGPARLGRRNRIYPSAVIGAPPQDRSYGGEPTMLEVGDDNVFREQVTVHRGTLKGGGTTRIGSRCLLMVGAHVAHDATLEDDVVLTNLATLGGHCHVAANVVCGGHAAVAPFVRLGRGAFLAGGAMVERDVPPFVIAAGDRARVRALNRVGLVRMGVSESSRRALGRAFRLLYRGGEPLRAALDRTHAELGSDPYVAELVDFLRRSAT
jgi:UDP-N-acetylglucosamine acyltransferase